MVARRITSTFSADFVPLGTPGQRSFDLITRETAEIGTAHRALYAEPFVSPQGDSIDWYAAVPGPAVQLMALDPGAAEAARARLAELIIDIQARAARLQADQDQDRRRLGVALSNSVIYPGDESVFVVDEQPVIVCWAHQSIQGAAPVSALTQATPRTPVPAEQVPEVAPLAQPPQPEPQIVYVQQVPVERAPFGWLWWLLWGAIGAMAVAMALILLPACGLSFLPWLDRCAGTPTTVTAAMAQAERRDVLQAEIDRLERELEVRDLACLPTPPPPVERRAEAPPDPAPVPVPAPPREPEPEPEPEPTPEQEEIDQRVEQQGGETEAPLRVTLVWENISDLDLRLTTPADCSIYHARRRNCGGVLDVDQNARSDRLSNPVENIVFSGTPERGSYTIIVRNFEERTSGGTPFKVLVYKDGQLETFNGRLQRSKQTTTFRFTYP